MLQKVAARRAKLLKTVHVRISLYQCFFSRHTVDQGAVGGRYATVVGLALAVLFVVIILLSCIILLAKRIVKTKAEMTMDIPLSELPVHLTSKRRLTDFVPYPAGAKGTDEVDGYPTPDYPADGYADENGRKVKSRVMGDAVENVAYIPFVSIT